MSTPDTEQTMFFSRPEGLARILSQDEDSTQVWNPAEMKAMWLHQLAAPLEADLATVSRVEVPAVVLLAAFGGKTFRELLHHTEPPLALLNLAKEFAKQTLKDSDDKQLKEIASALYYASYAAAITRCGASLGSLQSHHLVAGYGWALERAWLDEVTRELIGAALRQVSPK